MVDRPDDQPAVSVVICTRDRIAMLEATLAAVGHAMRATDELVVVDSASVDPGVKRVAEQAGAAYVRCEIPGLSRARNAGVAASSEPFIAFTDDDCRPGDGWTTAIGDEFRDATIGFVAGRVVALAGDGDDTAHVGSSITISEGTTRRRFMSGDDPIDIGHGANMAFRRDALARIGGFDELLGAGGHFRAGEDHDAFWRVMRHGWDGVYAPDSVVAHSQWRTHAAEVKLSYGYGLGAGAFAVKTMRREGRPARALLRRRLWGNGIAQMGHDIRIRYKTGAAGSAVKTIGTLVGVAKGARLPLDGERYEA